MSMRRALGAPTRGAGTALAVTEGSPVFGLLPLYKRQANVQTTTVIPKPVTDVTGRGNPFFLYSSMFLHSIKENGLPRRFAPRNDRLVLI